jgi:general secretion pathway protein F
MFYKIEYIKNSQKKELIIKADSKEEAINKFLKRKLGAFLNIEEVAIETLEDKLAKIFDFSKIDEEEVLLILEQLYVMLNAGISIDRALEMASDNLKSKKLKKIFVSVMNDVKAGLSLSVAFSKFSDELGNLFISMIKLGEETGDLASAIKDLSEIIREILDNKKRLKKATRYPIFIIFAMMIAFVIVIIFVIPQFKSIFAQMDLELPLPTRVLLWVEAALRKYGIYILIGAIFIMGVVNYFYKKDERIRIALDKFMLKIYVVGDVIRFAMIGRFIYVLKKLLQSGVPLIDALENALAIVDNLYIKKNLEAIKMSVISGNSMSRGFEESKMFEPLIIQMINAGEESGHIVDMLDKISQYYLDKYRYIVDNIAVLVEPILIAAIAGFIFTLALGIFLPMWSLTEIAGK